MHRARRLVRVDRLRPARVGSDRGGAGIVQPAQRRVLFGILGKVGDDERREPPGAAQPIARIDPDHPRPEPRIALRRRVAARPAEAAFFERPQRLDTPM